MHIRTYMPWHTCRGVRWSLHELWPSTLSQRSSYWFAPPSPLLLPCFRGRVLNISWPDKVLETWPPQILPLNISYCFFNALISLNKFGINLPHPLFLHSHPHVASLLLPSLYSLFCPSRSLPSITGGIPAHPPKCHRLNRVECSANI